MQQQKKSVKRAILLGLIVGLTFLIPIQTLADEWAFQGYVGGTGTLILPTSSDVNILRDDVDLSMGGGGVGTIGLQARMSQSLVVFGELEGGFRSMGIDELDVTGDVQTSTGMANIGLKFFGADSTAFNTYAAVGFGFAQHEVTFNGLDLDDNVFALQTLVGMEYALTESLSGRAGYRFFGTANLKDQDIEATYRTHGIDFGLFYYF